MKALPCGLYWIRTGDLFLTKEVLYRLSYMSASFPTLERVVGIEPTYSAWKADVLPMNYPRQSPSQTLHQMTLEHWADLAPTSLAQMAAP